VTSFNVGLVADDLTGANDTAVQFARRGWEALLVLERGQTPFFVEFARMPRKKGSDHFSVFAVTTDSRALDNAAAEQLTADAVAQLMQAGVDRIYLKIDSTMRGSVPGQIAGALKAWGLEHPGTVAVVCPAYPRMQRTIVDNQLLVGGEPVERSAIGRDPVTPVKMSNLTALIPGSRHVSADELANNAPRVMTVDARSDEDLAELASAIDKMGTSAIPVGSAGLADAIATVWGRGVRPGWAKGSDPVKEWGRAPFSKARILIQVTSLNPVSHAQLAQLARVFPEVNVLSGRAEDVSVVFADRVIGGKWDLLGLVGGDGARAAMRVLGASAIRVVDAVMEGIPLGIVVGGQADGMLVFTKAGGFGNEDALVRLVQGLTK
jgi:D-threonate/D-erythronate kinase